MSTVALSAGVWCRFGSRTALAQGQCMAADRRAAARLPGWRAAQFLTGRSAVRGLLRDVLPNAAEAPISAEPGHKPMVAGFDEVSISISHSEHLVAVAVSAAGPVGIDLQLPPDSDCARLLRRCASRYLDHFAVLPDTERAVQLAWIWTAQEACVKATGEGLAGLPWQIDVRPGQSAGRWRQLSWLSLRESSAVPVSCAWRTPPATTPDIRSAS
ncbi:MAG: 4-phosphopantetheinyl transferase [Pseudonocardiales bacterium]|jgi:4'-phosphopantetheinyl transferase|nr:4-phosphopantetheinyl transferase [Pseudonocardiales bacterium]